MRELEKYYYEYIFLGLPSRAVRELLKFRLKKGKRPVVFTKKAPLAVKLLGLADLRFYRGLDRDGIILELVERYITHSDARIVTLIPTEEFESFVERNKEWLEARTLIRRPEEIYR